MKQSASVKWGNLKVGLLLIFVLVILLWASFSGGGTSIFESKKTFVCYFPNVNGLVPGAPVWMSGVEVGNVRTVRFAHLDADRQVELVCRVKNSVWNMMTADARVQLGTIGFLGDKYVEVVPGTKGGPSIEEGMVVPTQEVADASALFSSGQEAFDNMGSLVTNLDNFTARMNAGEGTLGMMATDKELYNNLSDLLARLSSLAADLQKNQERLTASLERTSHSIEDLSTQVTQNTGTLGRIVNDPQLYDNLAATSARLDTIMSAIQLAEGSLGLMVNDTALYVELTNLLHRANNLVADIEKNPRKYLKFSVF